jgi:hypothetical protein
MKHKLTEVLFKDLKFTNKDLNRGTVVNVTYLNDTLEFQTPRMCIDDIIKDSTGEYLLLKLLPNEACKKFFLKILELESCINVESLFNGDLLMVKVPYTYSKPMVNVSYEGSLFNYYHLSKGMEIICLLTLNKLWINEYKTKNYNLTVKEIMLLKK